MLKTKDVSTRGNLAGIKHVIRFYFQQEDNLHILNAEKFMERIKEASRNYSCNDNVCLFKNELQ